MLIFHLTPTPVSKHPPGGLIAMKRSKLSNKNSRKLFTRTADRVNTKNMQGSPMRGGIRL